MALVASAELLSWPLGNGPARTQDFDRFLERGKSYGTCRGGWSRFGGISNRL